jgi:NAD(P)-dependent dehydrogenase (short-subunit alcohol dehydrogenase family)
MGGEIVLVTGASAPGGFGRLSANAVALGGHTVYAAMSDIAGRNARQADDIRAYAHDEGVDLRAMELDAGCRESVDKAVSQIVAEHGCIDAIVHAAGRMAFGPAEAFTAEQFAELYDVNVLSAQRVNRAALPHMRRRGRGLLVWLSSSGSAGGTPPYLSPYVAAKAAMDALAVQYARELARWGIETSIVVPGAFKRVDPFVRAIRPADPARVADYGRGPTAGLDEEIPIAFARIVPDDADTGAVAGAIAGIVDTPFGERPFRVHIDPSDDGADVAFAVIDRVRAEMLHRLGLPDLLRPAWRKPQ